MSAAGGTARSLHRARGLSCVSESLVSLHPGSLTDAVGPSEADLDLVLAATASGIQVRHVELRGSALHSSPLWKGLAFSNMTPVVPAWNVPVMFSSERGSWVSRPSIEPPVEYHEQNAACMYRLAYSIDNACGQGLPCASAIWDVELPMVLAGWAGIADSSSPSWFFCTSENGIEMLDRTDAFGNARPSVSNALIEESACQRLFR